MTREILKKLHRQLLGINRQTADMTRIVERMLADQVRQGPDPCRDPETESKIKEIVTILNNTCNTHFAPENAETAALIRSRLDEGRTVEDFKAVIGICHAAWADEPKMRIYLRPATLFGDRFESYLQAAVPRSREDFREIEKMMISRLPEGI